MLVLASPLRLDNGYCDEQLNNRMKEQSQDKSDIMAILLAAANHKPGKQLAQQEVLTLRSDSRTIIVADSDTTAATLTHVFYYLFNRRAK